MVGCCGYRCILASAESSVPNSCRISTKAQSGRAARWRHSTGPDRRQRFTDQARSSSLPFRRSRQCHQVGRPDDGTDTGGFVNTEYFVDLKPQGAMAPGISSEQRRTDRRHESRARRKFPASIWNFSQPIEDNVEKRSPAPRARWRSRFSARLKTLEEKGDEIADVMSQHPGHSTISSLSRISASPISTSRSTAKQPRDSESTWPTSGCHSDCSRRQRRQPGPPG